MVFQAVARIELPSMLPDPRFILGKALSGLEWWASTSREVIPQRAGKPSRIQAQTAVLNRLEGREHGGRVLESCGDGEPKIWKAFVDERRGISPGCPMSPPHDP